MPRVPDLPLSNEALLQLMLDAAVDFAIFAMRADGTVLRWNRGAERLLGYSEGEILDQHCDVIFTPEDRLAGAPQEELRQALLYGRAEDERWHMRKDGSRFWGSGLLMPLPARVGFVKVMRDQTVKYLAEKRIEASEARFRTLATNIPQLVFSARTNGARTWSSPQWVIFTGLREIGSLEFGWLDAIHAEDRELTRSAWDEARDSGEYYVEHRIRDTRGQYRWHQTRATPLQPTQPLNGEWVGTSTDIHELRTLQDSQQVLLAELQHRTRNLLAMVQSIARRGARTSNSLNSFLSEFESRVRALSRAESLLPASETGTVNVRELIARELAAHAEASHGLNKVHIAGEEVGIAAGSAQIVALALHELATNAVKYGALRHETGRLHIGWGVRANGENRTLEITWRESGVPMPESQPQRKGYGTELIGHALPYQLSAETHLEFGPDGVECRIRLPLQETPAESG